MEKGKRGIYYIIIAVLSVSVLCLSIGYAALSATLTSTVRSVVQTSLTWDVGFEAGTVMPEAGGTNDTVGRECGSATVKKSTVTIEHAKLSKPQDSCLYELTIKNLGDIDAQLTSISPQAPGGTSCEYEEGAKMICDNITYILSTDREGTTPLEASRLLESKTGELKVYLKVSYEDKEIDSTHYVSDSITHTEPKFTLTYSQN